LAHAGLDVTYHDLEGSRTAGFAQHVFKDSELKVATKFTNDWKPTFPRNRFDAVIALDFFEHLVNVDVWAKAVHSTLKKTGVFMAQNAFACGDAEHGDSIPMHLSANNKYTEEWAPLMTKIGFTKMDSGWYQK
jgi:cyclopropane fatty-acyl-phospholipid synthase-like methyltransferase